MSILNVWAGPKHAIVAVDSRLVRDDGSGTGAGEPIPGAVEKLRVFAGPGVVYAGRGSAKLQFTIGTMLAGATSLDGIDAFDRAFPEVFRQAWEMHVRGTMQTGGLGLTGSVHYLVGWSAASERMRAIAFEKAEPGADAQLQCVETGGTYLAPWHDEQGELPRVDSTHSMLEACRRQIDFGERLHGARSGIGWPCVVADILPDEISVRRHLVRLA